MLLISYRKQSKILTNLHPSDPNVELKLFVNYSSFVLNYSTNDVGVLKLGLEFLQTQELF